VIVLDASVALKWFVDEEPLTEEARVVLHQIEGDPHPYLVPEVFMNEMLAVLSRLPGASASQVQEALGLIEALGLGRVGNGHDLLTTAADFAFRWKISGYDATYLALASLTGGVWLTADTKAVKRVAQKSLWRLLGG
jgi:predicted nucleic acid-binding protein